jgi:hypothetical protein
MGESILEVNEHIIKEDQTSRFGEKFNTLNHLILEIVKN